MEPLGSDVARRGRLAVWPLLIAMVLASCADAGGQDAGDNGSPNSEPAADESAADAAAEDPSDNDFEPMELKVATFGGPEDVHSRPLQAFAEHVESETDGRVSFEFFYGGSLVGAAELAGGLRDGIIDLATIFPAYTPAEFPIDAWASPLAFVPDSSPVVGSLQAIASTLEWGFETPEYLAEFEGQGLKVLLPRIQTSHQYNIACMGDASSHSALQGQRIRVGGEAHAGEAEALGAVPVTMSLTEAFTSLQQGVIDCSAVTPTDLERLGLEQLVKHYNFVGLTGWSSNMFAMNQDVWDSLPAEVQGIFWDGLPVYLEAFLTTEFQGNLDFAQLDLEFHAPDDDIVDAMSGYHDDVLESAANDTDSGLDDPAAALDRYLQVHARWLEEVRSAGYDDDPADWLEYSESHDGELPDLEPWLGAVTENVLEPNRP